MSKLKTNFDFNEFEIGDWVVVTSLMEMDYVGNIRVPTKIELTESIVGQIVGVKKFFMGTYKGSYKGSNYYDSDDPPYLSVKKGDLIYAWEVKTGLLNRPVYAWNGCINGESKKFTNVDELMKDLYRKLPIINVNITDKDRKNLSCTMKYEMKNWPRDEKGRWKK